MEQDTSIKLLSIKKKGWDWKGLCRNPNITFESSFN